MNRKIFIGIVSGLLALGLHAETLRVMRFVPVAGEEREVELNTLRKVVFTQDSVVLISATDGAQTPMYKFDYQRIVFDESGSQQWIDTVPAFQPKPFKFIHNGQLLIRLDGQVYTIMGLKIQ